MYAIRTRYLGPTNHRGSRIKVTDTSGRSHTFGYPYHANRPHEHCANALLAIFNPGAENLSAVEVCRTEDDKGFIYTTSRDVVLAASVYTY